MRKKARKLTKQERESIIRQKSQPSRYHQIIMKPSQSYLPWEAARLLEIE